MCNTIQILLKVYSNVHNTPMCYPDCKLDMAFGGLHVEKQRCVCATGYGNTKEYFNTHNIRPDRSQIEVVLLHQLVASSTFSKTCMATVVEGFPNQNYIHK
jgi:hypothetical protein